MAIHVNPLLNVKDSRWLQLEVCREFQRNKCSRSDSDCKFAHPGSNVEIQNGRVIACYDSIKGRCNREKPPCKYFHPPKHLKEQLIINGKNHLALKNALLHQVPFQTAAVAMAAGQLPTLVGSVPNLLNAYQTRSNSFVHPTPPPSQPSHPHPALMTACTNNNPLAAAYALNAVHAASIANATGVGPPTSALVPAHINSISTKAQNPYLTNLSAIAASSAAYGAYPTPAVPPIPPVPNNAAAAAAAAAMLMSPQAAVAAAAAAADQFSFGSLAPAATSMPAVGAVSVAPSAIVPPTNPTTTTASATSGSSLVSSRLSPSVVSTSHSNAINPNSTGTSLTTTSNIKPAKRSIENGTTPNIATATASLESHVLTEASSINAAAAVANAAAIAAAAVGRKRNRDPNDELLMIPGSYPSVTMTASTKRPALEKNGTPLFHHPTATATMPTTAMAAYHAAAAAAAHHPHHHPHHPAAAHAAQPFAMHHHQPLVPLSFYFPLLSQTNTIPRY